MTPDGVKEVVKNAPRIFGRKLYWKQAFEGMISERNVVTREVKRLPPTRR